MLTSKWYTATYQIEAFQTKLKKTEKIIIIKETDSFKTPQYHPETIRQAIVAQEINWYY